MALAVEVATVPLALDDLVPVVLAGLGAFWLADLVRRRQPDLASVARTGAGLVLLGGLCKALWKLTLAVSDRDITWLADGLFGLLAPGFTFLAWSLLAVRRRRLPLPVPVGVLGVGYAAALALETTGPLLAVTVISSTTTGVIALLLAREGGDLVAAVLFGLQLAMAYALVPLAGSGQTLSRQWWEQSLNTVGQAAFAVAAFRLRSNDVPASNDLALIRSTS